MKFEFGSVSVWLVSGSRIGGSLDFPSGLGQTLDSVRDSGLMGFRLSADAQGEYGNPTYRDLAQAVFVRGPVTDSWEFSRASLR